ncbi:hypothetical protein MKEN_00381300 [Mycena kentingensis (nom. inval.)]|nr:hypothetical protein MKEN_00381300 [Mycena kentingensis (nom. inval.)]
MDIDYVQRIVRSLDPSVPPSYDSSAPAGPPGYTSRRAMTEHQYTLASRGNKPPWATLKLLSRSPNPSQLPTILEGDRLVGAVVLNLDKSDGIVGVSVVAKGQVVPGPDDRDPLTFLELTTTLWSKDRGDPRNPTTPTRKLTGHYEWPFSLEIPASVVLDQGTFRLPQTFVERRFPTSVSYVLVLQITRGRFRVNSRIHTSLHYVPATRPSPPSPLRQLAYRQSTPLIGPEGDPAGWEQLPPFTVRGTAFKTRTVEATCWFSLAKPLCYTRGSQVPCAITLSCTDTQALDLLSAPRAVNVALRRRLRPIPPASRRTGMFDANADLSADPAETVALASWWPPAEGAAAEAASATSHRRLEGEISLPVTLKPSARMAHFAVEYSVEVLPFKAIAFIPEHGSHPPPFVCQPIEIVTMHASGVVPRSYAPPQYSASQEEAVRDNYFNADGLGHVWRT